MTIFVSMKVPRGDAELDNLAALAANVIRQAGHEPFIATDFTPLNALQSIENTVMFHTVQKCMQSNINPVRDTNTRQLPEPSLNNM